MITNFIALVYRKGRGDFLHVARLVRSERFAIKAIYVKVVNHF